MKIITATPNDATKVWTADGQEVARDVVTEQTKLHQSYHIDYRHKLKGTHWREVVRNRVALGLL